MKSQEEKDRTYLRWNIQRGISWIHYRGYHWFVHQYLPAIQCIEAKVNTPEDYELLSDAYYYVGDVHFFNDAPFAAIRAYKKSVAYDPSQAEVLSEIGRYYSMIGRYAKAQYYLQQALAIRPDDPDAHSDLEIMKHDMAHDFVPIFQKDSLIWKIHECLAQQKFTNVLRLLHDQTSVQASQYRMNVYGALHQPESLLAEWKKIAEAQGGLVMQWRDWFYIKSVIWNSPEFWSIFLQCSHRFQHGGVWCLHESLWTVIPSPKRPKIGSKADLLRLQKRLKLYAQYQLARIHHDDRSAESLASSYPQWVEAVQLFKILQK